MSRRNIANGIVRRLTQGQLGYKERMRRRAMASHTIGVDLGSFKIRFLSLGLSYPVRSFAPELAYTCQTNCRSSETMALATAEYSIAHQDLDL
jgi:hypothetical protein